MKRIIFLSAVFAAVAQLSPAATCVNGTLGSYIGLGASGCTVGSSTVSDFQMLVGTTGATEISASSVFLSPLISSSKPGITTSVNVTSPTGSIQESLFTYQISGATYIGSTITLSKSSETGDGAVTGLENFCAGGSFGVDGVSGCTGAAGALATVDGAQNQDSSIFAAVHLISVTNDLTIDGGSVGSAAGATLLDQFSTPSTATPEPTCLLFTGVGLALVAVRRQIAHIGRQEKREQT